MRHMFLTTAIVLVALPAQAQQGRVPPAGAERGSMVTVQGKVARIEAGDAAGAAGCCAAIRVYVGPEALPAAVGEAVTVHGFVADGLAPRAVLAYRLTRADGAVVTFGQA